MHHEDDSKAAGPKQQSQYAPLKNPEVLTKLHDTKLHEKGCLPDLTAVAKGRCSGSLKRKHAVLNRPPGKARSRDAALSLP